MFSPKISVLMAVHNGMPYLLESLDSLLNQTFSDFELVIINDGSTDGTSRVLREYAEKDSRIIIITNDTKRTLPVSLNIGLEHCRGKWIARMDSDDVAHPDRLKVQLSLLENNSKIGLCGTDTVNIDETGNVIGSIQHQRDDKMIRFMLPFLCCFVHPSVMFNRELVLNAGGYDESMWTGQDYELWSRIIQETRTANIPMQLLRYRMHNSSMTSSKERKKVHDVFKLKVHRKLINNYLDRDLSDMETNSLLRLILSDRILDDNSILIGLPILKDYLSICIERENSTIKKHFKKLVAKSLLVQSYYLKGTDSKMRFLLANNALRINSNLLLSPKENLKIFSLFIPKLVWKKLKK